MARENISKQEAKEMFDDAVRILREDAQLAHNRSLSERLDRIEQQTRREPKTPEEKAAEYDRIMAGNNTPRPNGPGPAPVVQSGPPVPTPPAPKPPADPPNQNTDWWWGPNE